MAGHFMPLRHDPLNQLRMALSDLTNDEKSRLDVLCL
jgi:hypothetical protein